MANSFYRFEKIARKAYSFTDQAEQEEQALHPFDLRNIHPNLPNIVKKLFDDGHFALATFEAFKFLDKVVQKHSGLSSKLSGSQLFMDAFAEAKLLIKLTNMSNQSEIDEQLGYKFIFAGSASAIRNPRAHEVAVKDDPDKCLDHLSLASLLLRRLEEAGYKTSLENSDT